MHSTGGRRAWQRNYEQQRPSRSAYKKQLRQRRVNEIREYEQRRVRPENRLEYNREYEQQRSHIDRREYMQQWRQEHRDENAHSAKKMLLDVLDSSGSLITANSQRLRTLHDGQAKEIARHDVSLDISRYVEVSLEDKADCTRDYAADALPEMQVCGACGLRDPTMRYALVQLSSLGPDHWLRVCKDAYARLQNQPALELLRHVRRVERVGTEEMDAADSSLHSEAHYQQVTVPQELFYNLTEIDGDVFHIIPEALRDSSNISMCSRCHRGFSQTAVAQRKPINEETSDTKDRFDDMYSSNAPKWSIASGADFGRMSGLRNLGVQVDVSTLERLLLGEGRCHHVVYKVTAYGTETLRQRLYGHSIVCPHEPSRMPEFGEEAIEAAFGALRLVFVGPQSQQTKLERVALKIDDLRLRPVVIFNFLTIKHMLHGSETRPPSIERIQELLATHGGLQGHIKRNARRVTDEAAITIERNSIPSDIANVRSAAQSPEEAALGDDDEAEQAPTNEELAPCMNSFGVLEMQQQEMDAVISGVGRLFNSFDSSASNEPGPSNFPKS